MSKKVVISIPVHESPECIENHLHNIQKFVGNSAVVLHASTYKGSTFYKEVKKLIENKFKNFAYLNNNSFNTHAPGENANVTGLSTVHCSNFKYIDNIIDFDYFALETSNDMFVRKGVEYLWNNYDCGVPSHQRDTSICRNDGERSVLNRISQFINVQTVEIHAPEGTFYPKDTFKEISVVVDKMGGFLGCEEILIPTLAFNIDHTLYNKNCNSSYIFHNSNDRFVKKEDALSTRNNEKNNKYAVKRVPRDINDECRNFINEITQND